MLGWDSENRFETESTKHYQNYKDVILQKAKQVSQIKHSQQIRNRKVYDNYSVNSLAKASESNVIDPVSYKKEEL